MGSSEFLPYAQDTPVPFEELARDPVLFVAGVLLVAVSVAWLLVIRMMARGHHRIRTSILPVRKPRPDQDIWKSPP
jgi:hypothetical protein